MNGMEWLVTWYTCNLPRPPALLTSVASLGVAALIIGPLQMRGALVQGNHFWRLAGGMVQRKKKIISIELLAGSSKGS